MAWDSYKHEIDPWGYYCESWCKECQANQRFCKVCETHYGEGQRHEGYECNQRLKNLLDRQQVFPFMKISPWKDKS